MKIVVMNGSPKGEYSNTIHHLKYIMKHRPGHEYQIIEVGRDIKKIEKDPVMLDAILGKIKNSDAMLWSFPLYHYSVPSQLMRFIEIVSERGKEEVFHEKYATALTTSVHFYDHIAHNYIHAISEDLGMNYVEGFSAEMGDLQKPEWRERMLLFFDHFTATIEGLAPVAKKYAPISIETKAYEPGEPKSPISMADKKILLITDAREEDLNLGHMVDVFKRSVGGVVHLVNLNEINMAGGCLGCLQCGDENVCVYKDDLRGIYYEKMAGADAVVFAGTIRGRSLSSRWKMFWDRSFVNGHCPIVSGRQYGFIISGPLRQLSDLREELESRAQVSDNNLAGIITDEYEDPEMITALIGQLAADLAWGISTGYRSPPTFLGVGGHLLFRDLIYHLSFIFRADDRYYKKNGLYDYPQKEYGRRLQNSTMKMMMSIKKIRRVIYTHAKEENAKGYQKIIDAN